jgi:hypothetical protein
LIYTSDGNARVEVDPKGDGHFVSATPEPTAHGRDRNRNPKPHPIPNPESLPNPESRIPNPES